jgi:pyrroline-5-carboxylate reductase
MLTRLLVLGGGRMGEALLGGLLRAGWIEPAEITVAERHAGRRAELLAQFPGIQVSEVPVAAASAVLAVKPGDAVGACGSLAGLGITRLVSIVAGVRIADLEALLDPSTVVLRAMPNIPALVGAAASGLAGSSRASEEDFGWGEGVLSAFGVVARVPERMLDAVTGLSGSGPAYVLMMAEALVEAGVAQGLDREVSRLLTGQTLLGTARLLTEMGEPAEQLRARVTSPGGTTAAGLRSLERSGFRSAIIEAVAAATDRARELGESSA